MDSNTITIRAFRAIDDYETCKKFYDGHVNVLKSYGIEPISSAKNEWFSNPSVYGLIAEKNKEIIGGLKIHKIGGTQTLPLEDSIGILDSKIYDILNNHSKDGVGEGCGLWNTREFTGSGLSYELSRAMIAISKNIGVNKLFLLASNHTLAMTRKLGFRVVKSLGTNGRFNYPTPKYIAQVVIGHTQNISWATPYNREIIISLRNEPGQTRKSVLKNNSLTIKYQLELEKAVTLL